MALRCRPGLTSMPVVALLSALPIIPFNYFRIDGVWIGSAFSERCALPHGLFERQSLRVLILPCEIEICPSCSPKAGAGIEATKAIKWYLVGLCGHQNEDVCGTGFASTERYAKAPVLRTRLLYKIGSGILSVKHKICFLSKVDIFLWQSSTIICLASWVP